MSKLSCVFPDSILMGTSIPYLNMRHISTDALSCESDGSCVD